MYKTNIMNNHWFILDPERESQLWQNGVFVFDTSSFCALYGLIPSSQKAMIDILDKFNSRIWIPAQVIYEYLKNREKVIMNPCNEFYQNPKAIFKCNLIPDFDEVLSNFENEDFHPYISQTVLNELKEHRDTLDKTLKKIKNLIKSEYHKQKTQIEATKQNDIILNSITNYPHGKPFIMSEIIDIIREGELRYRNLIPPGYMDLKDKKGIQIYGDLIIWKEILRFAEEQKKNIIFICDDVKEDWYITIDKNNRIITPRHELIKEFCDSTGKDCWIYPLSRFIDKLEEFHKEEDVLPLYHGLEAIRASLINKEKRELIKSMSVDGFLVSCDECGHLIEIDGDDFDWAWECIGGEERSMGIENQYVSEGEICCPKCKKDIHIKFNVWEYPVGAYNYSDIDIDGGSLESDFDFDDRIHFPFEEDDGVCFKCGRHGSVGIEGLCNECLEGQERID